MRPLLPGVSPFTAGSQWLTLKAVSGDTLSASALRAGFTTENGAIEEILGERTPPVRWGVHPIPHLLDPRSDFRGLRRVAPSMTSARRGRVTPYWQLGDRGRLYPNRTFQDRDVLDDIRCRPVDFGGGSVGGRSTIHKRVGMESSRQRMAAATGKWPSPGDGPVNTTRTRRHDLCYTQLWW